MGVKVRVKSFGIQVPERNPNLMSIDKADSCHWITYLAKDQLKRTTELFVTEKLLSQEHQKEKGLSF